MPTRAHAASKSLEHKHSGVASQATSIDCTFTRHERESIALTCEIATNACLYCLRAPGSLHSPSKGTVLASHE